MARRYTFRLTEDDRELYNLLERVPSSKRSEVIREMLKFAYRKAMEEERQNQQLARLEKLLTDMKQEIDERFRAMEKKLVQGIVVQKEQTNTAYSRKVDEASVKESAEALLSSFGIMD